MVVVVTAAVAASVDNIVDAVVVVGAADSDRLGQCHVAANSSTTMDDCWGGIVWNRFGSCCWSYYIDCQPCLCSY